ncbi:hypothetical protein ACOJTA_03310 [Malaciobacter sp. WC5094]
MNVKEFVNCWKKEKDNCLKIYTNDVNNDSLVASKISKMNLNLEQKLVLNEVLNDILNDTFYTFLLGLDGAASIGGQMQEAFKIYDEKGNLVAGIGELEIEAYEQFINK